MRPPINKSGSLTELLKNRLMANTTPIQEPESLIEDVEPISNTEVENNIQNTGGFHVGSMTQDEYMQIYCLRQPTLQSKPAPEPTIEPQSEPTLELTVDPQPKKDPLTDIPQLWAGHEHQLIFQSIFNKLTLRYYDDNKDSVVAVYEEYCMGGVKNDLLNLKDPYMLISILISVMQVIKKHVPDYKKSKWYFGLKISCRICKMHGLIKS